MAKYGLLFFAGFFLIGSSFLCKAYIQDTLHDAEPGHIEYFLTPEKRGERLFLGLRTQKTDARSCVSCHNITPVDTLNWNPSALEIAQTFASQPLEAFKTVLMKPLGRKMPEVHTNYEFSDEELAFLKAYLSGLKEAKALAAKPKINNLLLFLFLGILITLALIDIFITKKIKYKLVSVLVFLLAFGYQIKMLVEGAVNLGRTQYYAPDQPIKFSHQVHATDNKIDCRYCHTGVEDSKSAGIPAVTLCLNCHIIVREGTNSGKFEIKKIHAAVEKNQPIQWIRIHQLPDHVFFSHAQHVKVGKRECEECHGEVKKMHILRQQEDLSMGWCIDCHDKTAVDFQINNYYSGGFKNLREDLLSGAIDSVTVSKIGGRECGHCHY